MSRLGVPAYLAELDEACKADLPWGMLAGKTVAVTGATGMIGACLIDLIMRKNELEGLGCNVVALGRSEKKARLRLPYFDRPEFSFEEIDVAEPGARPSAPADYVLHLASSTHPRQYATDPIGTIKANVAGLESMLEYAASCEARLLFASSVEVYGENRGDVERFSEDYCGYIDCNTLRACYTESKRLGEAMCQAYRSQRGVVEVVIPRIARVYGPTLLPDDSKALSQFIHRALAGEDVVLKSEGLQRFSYLYVADAVTGILAVLLNGEDGEAYNLADDSDVTLRELASMVADAGGVDLVFDLPDAVEAAGYSKASLALMDGSKAKALGWRVLNGVEEGIVKTIIGLKEADC